MGSEGNRPVTGNRNDGDRRCRSNTQEGSGNLRTIDDATLLQQLKELVNLAKKKKNVLQSQKTRLKQPTGIPNVLTERVSERKKKSLKILSLVTTLSLRH